MQAISSSPIIIGTIKHARRQISFRRQIQKGAGVCWISFFPSINAVNSFVCLFVYLYFKLVDTIV